MYVGGVIVEGLSKEDINRTPLSETRLQNDRRSVLVSC